MKLFGYLRIDKPEMKVKEYEMYKAVYCTLCRTLGRRYGILSRLTLSYDFTFLALLNLSLLPGCTEIEQKHCTFNPMKKCNFCKKDDAVLFPAGVAMIMLYYKLCDNIADEKGLKKIRYLLLKPFFAFPHKKAAREFPLVEEAVHRFITAQTALEAADCAELDRAADPTAKALSEIFAFCSTDPVQKRVLERLGYCMGRYIYLLDAACDLEQDRKTGSYNVLLKMPDSGEDPLTRVKSQLFFCINEAARAFELLDIKNYKSILGNIIYLGLENTFKKELQFEK